MKAKYKFNINVEISYDIDTLEGLKDNNEMAQDLRELICDNVIIAGGVAFCDVLKSEIDVR